MSALHFLLRDGSPAEDPRLDAIVHFDERSRNYPARALLPADAVPKTRCWLCPLHLDQGNEGACVGFACTHELVARPHMIWKSKKFARESVYWAAQRIDQWDGGMYPGAEPHYEGTTVLAGVKVLQRLGYIGEYRWAFGLEDLMLAVSHTGPAILGLKWWLDMSVPNGSYIRPSGHVLGRHAILCKGIDTRHKRFRLHNSWGLSWGWFGDAWITFEDMEQLLLQDGEACVPLVRQKGVF